MSDCKHYFGNLKDDCKIDNVKCDHCGMTYYQFIMREIGFRKIENANLRRQIEKDKEAAKVWESALLKDADEIRDLRAKLEATSTREKGLIEDYLARDREVTKWLNKANELQQDRDNLQQQLVEYVKTHTFSNETADQIGSDLNEHIDNLQAAYAVVRGELQNAKDRALSCVAKIRYGLGAGGHGSGMISEIEVGNVVLDGVADEIEESFAEIISTTPAEAGVRGLVETLEHITYSKEVDCLTAAVFKANAALAKYHGGEDKP